MCVARRYGDEMVCYACSLRWDVQDDEPPECNPKVGQGVKVPGGSRPTIVSADAANAFAAVASFAFVRELLSKNEKTSTTMTTGTNANAINTSW